MKEHKKTPCVKGKDRTSSQGAKVYSRDFITLHVQQSTAKAWTCTLFKLFRKFHSSENSANIPEEGCVTQ